MCRTQVSCTHSPKIVVENVISTGKFQVFLARSPSNNKQYAVKAFQKDEYSHASFVKEKRIHASLQHPNIIQYVPDYLFQIDISQFNVIFTEFAPYGDFFNLILDYNFSDEKLIRTYFHQLIEGLRYLHSKGIAHLDIKLDNLLLGKDFQLKIADFDLSQSIRDEEMVSAGTSNYRAPEVWRGTSKSFTATDIYSVGVCLYTFMTTAFPFYEDGDRESGRLVRYDTYVDNNEAFWAENEALMEGKVHFSESLKELLNKMWAPNPSDRLTLEQIMESKWYNEAIYTEEELVVETKKILMLD